MKAVITKAEFDALSAEMKALYKQDGEKFILQVEGITDHPDTLSLRNALQVERQAKEAREREIRELREKMGDLDPDEARKAQARLKELEEQAAIGTIPEALKPQFEKAVETRVQQMQRDFDNREKGYKAKIATLETEVQKVTGQLQSVTIEDEVRREGVKQGLHDWAIDDAVLRAKTEYVVENGKPIRKKDGQVVYGKVPTEPMPIGEFVAELASSRAGWVRESAGSGAQNNGGKGTGQNGEWYEISREDAQDSQKYLAAKEAAKKANKPFRVAPLPAPSA